MIADRPSVPPRFESVRQTTRFRFAPLLSQPPTLHGQYLLAVHDVLVAVQRRRDTHARAPDRGSVEVRGAARRAGGLARRVTDDELVARVTRRAADEPLLLLLGAVVPHRHEPETVDEDGRAEAGIDRLDFLGRDHEVDVGQSAAAVRLGEHRPGDALLASLLVGRLEHLPAGERIGLGVDLRRERSEDLLGEAPRHRLKLLLLFRQREINRHCSALSSLFRQNQYEFQSAAPRRHGGARGDVSERHRRVVQAGLAAGVPSHVASSCRTATGIAQCSQLDQPTAGVSTQPL